MEKQKQGDFWSLSKEVQKAIIQSTIQDAPEQRKINNEELKNQRKAKKEMQELIHELNLHNATEAYIEDWKTLNC